MSMGGKILEKLQSTPPPTIKGVRVPLKVALPGDLQITDHGRENPLIHDSRS